MREIDRSIVGIDASMSNRVRAAIRIWIPAWVHLSISTVCDGQTGLIFDLPAPQKTG